MSKLPSVSSATRAAAVDPAALERVAAALTGSRLKRHVPLAPYTTFKIGGPADLLFEADSADALAEARARFAALEAPLWEARAAEELERAAPGRADGALTRTEWNVARLVAEGRRNREIASSLFMSVHTVEAHLTRIYRKLGIRSRSDLTRLVSDNAITLSADEPS